jgi:hypothetical protein
MRVSKMYCSLRGRKEIRFKLPFTAGGKYEAFRITTLPESENVNSAELRISILSQEVGAQETITTTNKKAKKRFIIKNSAQVFIPPHTFIT